MRGADEEPGESRRDETASARAQPLLILAPAGGEQLLAVSFSEPLGRPVDVEYDLGHPSAPSKVLRRASHQGGTIGHGEFDGQPVGESAGVEAGRSALGRLAGVGRGQQPLGQLAQRGVLVRVTYVLFQIFPDRLAVDT